MRLIRKERKMEDRVKIRVKRLNVEERWKMKLSKEETVEVQVEAEQVIVG